MSQQDERHTTAVKAPPRRSTRTQKNPPSDNAIAGPAASDTAHLLHAASELARLLPIPENDPLGNERLHRFLAIYRSWIMRERGFADAPEAWAERFAILQHLMVAGATLREAVEILIRFADSVWGPDARPELQNRGTDVALIFRMPRRSGAEGVIHALWSLTITLSQLDFLAGMQLEGVTGTIVNSPALPAHIANLFFRAPTSFEAGENALIIPARELARAVAVRAADVPAFLRDLMAITVGARRSSPRMRALISNLLWNDRLRGLTASGAMRDIARRMNLSVATIRRRLRHEGTTFQRIKDEVSDHAAKMWLSEGGRTIEQVAESLGYSDAHAFRRAFRRRNGIPPRAYRSRVVAFPS